MSSDCDCHRLSANRATPGLHRFAHEAALLRSLSGARLKELVHFWEFIVMTVTRLNFAEILETKTSYQPLMSVEKNSDVTGISLCTGEI